VSEQDVKKSLTTLEGMVPCIHSLNIHDCLKNNYIAEVTAMKALLLYRGGYSDLAKYYADQVVESVYSRFFETRHCIYALLALYDATSVLWYLTDFEGVKKNLNLMTQFVRYYPIATVWANSLLEQMKLNNTSNSTSDTKSTTHTQPPARSLNLNHSTNISHTTQSNMNSTSHSQNFHQPHTPSQNAHTHSSNSVTDHYPVTSMYNSFTNGPTVSNHGHHGLHPIPGNDNLFGVDHSHNWDESDTISDSPNPIPDSYFRWDTAPHQPANYFVNKN